MALVLRERNRQLESNYNDLVADFEGLEIRLRDEQLTSQNKERRLCRQKGKLGRKIRDRESEINYLQNENEDLYQQNEELYQQNEDLNQQNGDLYQQNEDLNQQNGDLYQQNDDLNQIIEERDDEFVTCGAS